MKTSKSSVSRRSFITSVSGALAGITILPSQVIAGLGHPAPSDKLNIAGIGVGGMGYRNLKNMELQNIVALCDVDANYANRNSFREWPLAPRYSDFRVMFERQRDIDAVVIATPDHTHALPAVMAMRQGIHVYLQQPLAHSVFESRILAETAKRYGVATQMGNQGNSDDGIRDICEWIWAGKIGEVTRVDAWTKRPTWPQALERPEKEMRVPRGLDWDLFIGPAKMRPYNELYHPGNWRGWWDFGSGALGDMGSQILDPVFKALKLESPESVQASSTEFTIDSAPKAETICFEFPARDNLPKVAMPPLVVNWFDGGLMPNRPDELKDGERMGDAAGGCIFYGTKGKIICGSNASNPSLLPVSEMEHFQKPQRTLRRIPDAINGGHELDWIRACKESRENRVEASSNFAYAGPLNEMLMLGTMAVRMQSLNRKLKWDGANMRFSNLSKSDYLHMPRKIRFETFTGDSGFNEQYQEMPALAMADEWTRHTYRKGWEQI
ncbi:Gfo/Idh/MocA family protein [Mangrovibacterium sp.]|uniref:Gfo/Idh/MocA family protein n=1 Tax=Mangrovibacterium sp. TaxID=1961364 RepID=UPI0035640598